MVAHKCRRIEECENAIDNQKERDTEVADGIADRNVLPTLVHKDLGQRGRHKIQRANGRGSEEREEVSIIASADTVIYPDTVMVGRLNAIVAETAVVSTRRSPDVAGFAILCRHFHGSS